jgi:hypothetical protein
VGASDVTSTDRTLFVVYFIVSVAIPVVIVALAMPSEVSTLRMTPPGFIGRGNTARHYYLFRVGGAAVRGVGCTRL